MEQAGLSAGAFTSLLMMVLGHSLWQALLAMILLWAVLRRMRSGQAQLRYGACLAALGLVVVGVCITAAVLTMSSGGMTLRPEPSQGDFALRRGSDEQSSHAGFMRNHSSDSAASAASSQLGYDQPKVIRPSTGDSLPAASIAHFRADVSGDSALPDSSYPAPRVGRAVISTHPLIITISRWVALAWAGGVLLMLGRLFASVGGAGRLKRTGEAVGNTVILRTVEELRQRLRIKCAVGIRVSGEVAAPVVIGLLRPVILLPLAYLTGVSPEMLRAVIAHELAHIRRHDYLVNIIQMLIESLLFFNPCVWWISNQLRAEREACCDQIAAEATEDSHAYASALLVAAAMACGEAPPDEAVMAVARRGGMVNRIRRVLWPEDRTALRLPWYSVLAAVIMGFVVLAGLWTGSVAGVSLAKSLTSQERIELVEQAEEQFGGPAKSGLYSLDTRSTVSGILKLRDGKPVEMSTVIEVKSYGPRYASGGGVQVKPGGHFAGDVVCGNVFFSLGYPGYAPLLSGPYLLQPETPLTGLELIAGRGYRSQILVTDEQDQPKANAVVDINIIYPGAPNVLYNEEVRTGKDGIAVVENATTYPVQLKITAPEYQPLTRNLEQLPREKPLAIRLLKALVTSGTVVDGATGNPVPGAALLLAQSRGPTGNIQGSLTTSTVTDAKGVFTIKDLRDDTTYNFAVTAPPRRPSWLINVAAGDTGLVVEMGEPLILQGKVTGHPEKTGPAFYGDYRSYRRPALTVRDWIQAPGDHYMHTRNHVVPIQMRDGVGTFSIGGLSPGNVHISWDAGTPKDLGLQLKDSLYDLELSTESGEGTGTEWARKPPPEDASTRAVVLRFNVPEGDPAPAGTFMLNYKGVQGDPNSGRSTPIPLTGREMRFVLEAPSGVTYRADGTVGYWFEEGRFQVDAGAGEYVHVIDCRPAGSISGIILDEQKKPVTDVQVSVDRVTNRGTSGQFVSVSPSGIVVNLDGRFHITPLPLDEAYQVSVTRGNYMVVSDRIKLSQSAPTRRMTVQMDEGATLEGTAVDDDGNSAAGVPVKLTLKKNAYSASHLQEQLTDRNGQFRIDGINAVAQGEYFLEIPSRKGFQPTSIKVHPGQSPMQVKLKRGGKIQGRVTDEKTGAPLAGIEVFAIPSQREVSESGKWIQILAEEPTDKDGYFQFSNLPPGKHTFRPRAIGFVSEIIGTPGSGETLEIKVRKPERSE